MDRADRGVRSIGVFPVGPNAGGRPLPSLLGVGSRVLLRVGLVAAALLLANTLYLVFHRLADAVGWPPMSPSPRSIPALLQTMVLGHTALGLIVVTLMLAFLVVHLPKVWKRKHPAAILTGLGFAFLGIVILATGLFILTAAASDQNRWAWWAHVLAAVLVPAGYVYHRLVSYTRPARAPFARFGVVVAGLAAALVAVHLLGNRAVRLTPEAREAVAAWPAGPPAGSGSQDRPARLSEPGGLFAHAAEVPPDAVPPASPFFPSPVTTSTGGYVPYRLLLGRPVEGRADAVVDEVGRFGTVTDARIGAEVCARCHPDVVESWSSSAHRYASFNNPFYEATIRDLRAADGPPNGWLRRHMDLRGEEASTGRLKSKWCAGCHDPALLLTGQMSSEVDRLTEQAQAGLACLSCHSIDRAHGVVGNGAYNYDDFQEDPYLFAHAPEGSTMRFLHDASLKARPAAHMQRMLQPFFRTSEFCLVCHKVSLTEPLNEYRWLRGQNEYDAWHDSGVALNASRTFYLPPSARVCQDCHMPLEDAPLGDLAADDGQIRSHRFTSVNSALPFVRGDSAAVARVDSLLATGIMRVDVFAVRGTGDTEPRFLESDAAEIPAGETVRFDVVVRNLGVGHTYPGGTNDSNESWLRVRFEDEDGRVVAETGAVGADGHLDPMAHTYGVVLLDSTGARIQRRNAQDIHVTAARNLVGPGTADIARYSFTVPGALRGRTLYLRATLEWRKFDRAYTEFAYRTNPGGFPRFDRTPDLPIHTVAADSVQLRVVGPGQPIRVEDGPADDDLWTRYNDYGIGMLLQGATRDAARAFAGVVERNREGIDGHLNLARVHLADGDLAAAYDELDQVEAIRPGDARAAWVWANVHQEDGRYPEAEEAYLYVLESFPGDRAAWRQLGRVRYLDSRYEQAIDAFDRVLAIDPEDRVAHYHRMLSLRALGRDEEAARAAAAADRYLIDDAAQALTGAFRSANPGVNLMAQPIHTHPVDGPGS